LHAILEKKQGRKVWKCGAPFAERGLEKETEKTNQHAKMMFKISYRKKNLGCANLRGHKPERMTIRFSSDRSPEKRKE